MCFLQERSTFVSWVMNECQWACRGVEIFFVLASHVSLAGWWWGYCFELWRIGCLSCDSFVIDCTWIAHAWQMHMIAHSWKTSPIRDRNLWFVLSCDALVVWAATHSWQIACQSLIWVAQSWQPYQSCTPTLLTVNAVETARSFSGGLAAVTWLIHVWHDSFICVINDHIWKSSALSGYLPLLYDMAQSE